MLIKPIKYKNIQINLWTVILFAFGLYFRFFNMLLASYIITAIHEVSHIWACKICGVRVDSVEVLPFGITMKIPDDFISDTSCEIKIAMAGPLSNFLICYFVYGFYNGALKEYIIFTSMAMGLFNMLPVLPLDGGRALRAIMVKKNGHIRASNILLNISLVFSILIIITGLVILYVSKFNFSFLLVGAFLTGNITEEKKRANMIIIKDILYSRKKLSKKGAAQGKILITDQSQRAKNILNMLSYDRYYIIKILDSKMSVAATITETQLIESMAIYGMNISMKKIVENRL